MHLLQPLRVGFALLAVPLGLSAWLLARHGLAAMDAGRMDPGGREETRHARTDGLAAVVLAIPGTLVIASGVFD